MIFDEEGDEKTEEGPDETIVAPIAVPPAALRDDSDGDSNSDGEGDVVIADDFAVIVDTEDSSDAEEETASKPAPKRNTPPPLPRT
jgi:hypothetical protein